MKPNRLDTKNKTFTEANVEVNPQIIFYLASVFIAFQLTIRRSGSHQLPITFSPGCHFMLPAVEWNLLRCSVVNVSPWPHQETL